MRFVAVIVALATVACGCRATVSDLDVAAEYPSRSGLETVRARPSGSYRLEQGDTPLLRSNCASRITWCYRPSAIGIIARSGSYI